MNLSTLPFPLPLFIHPFLLTKSVIISALAAVVLVSVCKVKGRIEMVSCCLLEHPSICSSIIHHLSQDFSLISQLFSFMYDSLSFYPPPPPSSSVFWHQPPFISSLRPFISSLILEFNQTIEMPLSVDSHLLHGFNPFTTLLLLLLLLVIQFLLVLHSFGQFVSVSYFLS